jgi:superfamily I DNA and/or RNA helicase
LGFLIDGRRLNVALTRARDALIGVGDSNLLSTGEDVGRWMNWVKDKKVVVRENELWNVKDDVATINLQKRKRGEYTTSHKGFDREGRRRRGVSSGM